MRNMRALAGSVIGSMMLATVAGAFPSWMGAYGAFERHTTNGNPGTYTILMNQDYYGLNAEVGVQVNNGAWNVFPMSYAGNTDGNSKWTYTPANGYPAGTTVKYYFHGWDSWGGHIYDSLNGQNYSFTIPAGNTNGLSWSPAAQLPVQASISGSPDLTADAGILYAAWGTRSNDYNSPVTIWLAKKLANAAWQAPQQVVTLNGSFQTPRIAVSGSYLHLLVPSYDSIFYLRSGNGGASWDSFGTNAFLVLTNAIHAEIRADADNAYVIFNRYAAPDNSRLFFTKKANNIPSFTEPQFIFSNVSYKTTVYVKDFDVSGTRLALLTVAQGWYGGFSKYFLHQSADGGVTWSGGEQPGAAAQMALRPATGSISYLTPDTGPGGAGLYFQSKPFDWGSWKQGYANVWAGEGTCDGLRWVDNKLLALSQRNGLRYCSVGSAGQDEVVQFGSPSLVDADNRWAVEEVVDGNRLHLLTLQSGSNNTFFTYSTRDNSAVPVQWIGNTYHWPGNAELDSTDDMWVNTETFPKGAATNVQITYSVNGSTNWSLLSLTFAGSTAANDQWHIMLGKFPVGATIRYALVAKDGAGVDKWDNNGGQDFTARVSNNFNLPQPVFWGLDPYRYDNEKVRVNGKAGDANKVFGQFPTGTAITVATRPVENGNGNNVQTTCSIVSRLTYTTTPGNWENAVTVTGVFHGAAFSNKPIYDYFTYSIGALPPGAQVEFWLMASNAAGIAYGQSEGQNFKFSVAGNSNPGDSDSDGLPDQWELDWFQSLSQNATNNVDGDGPIGRPLANIIEWAIGTQPTVPNDPTGIRLMWSPAYPAPGDTVTLSYFYGNEGNPLFGKPVYAHVGHNGWQATYDTRPLQPNGAIGRFEIQVQVPANATELNVVFHNSAGIWDNNGGRDWRIPVRPVSPPAAPSAKSAAGAIAPTSASKTIAAQETITATIRLAGLPGNLPFMLLVGRDGWKKAQVRRLVSAADGSLQTTYTLPSGQHDLNFALRGRNGTLYGIKGRPWTYTLAGNADQTIVIDLTPAR